MLIAIMKFDMWLDGAEDLKYKSSVFHKTKTRIKKNYNASVSKINTDSSNPDHLIIGVSIVGTNEQYLNESMNVILDMVDKMSLARIEGDEKEIIYFDKDIEY